MKSSPFSTFSVSKTNCGKVGSNKHNFTKLLKVAVDGKLEGFVFSGNMNSKIVNSTNIFESLRIIYWGNRTEGFCLQTTKNKNINYQIFHCTYPYFLMLILGPHQRFDI